jgi:3-hydroxyacyl-CoA dehydrogenase
VHPAILRETAVRAADRLVREGPPERERGGGASAALLDRSALGRRIVYRGAKQQLLKKTGGHYPAPLAALEVVRTGLEKGMEAGFAAEAQKFGELAVTGVSRNLVRLFFATTALKKDDGVPAGSVTDVAPVTRLGVVGSGFMGAGIAGTAVLKAEVEVRLRDAELSRVGKGLKAATALLDERLKRRHLTRPQHQRLAALLTGTDGYQGFGKAELVVEAVFEDPQVKGKLFRQLEQTVAEDSLLASNTSSIPIAQIASWTEHPERVIGLHFFSPVPVMKLVEIVIALDTSDDTVARADEFVQSLGKHPIHTKDRSGFIVNMLLVPYLMAAVRMYEDGFAKREDIDDGMKLGAGHPMGPLTLCDFIGLDVLYAVCDSLYEEFKRPEYAPPPLLKRMVVSGHHGRKTGRGFYEYE